MGRNNDDFLAGKGFSPEEQQEAVRRAKHDAGMAAQHHDDFHDSLFHHLDAMSGFDIYKDDDFLQEALEHTQDMKTHNELYQNITGRSLIGEDNKCTHCGKSVKAIHGPE